MSGATLPAVNERLGLRASLPANELVPGGYWYRRGWRTDPRPLPLPLVTSTGNYSGY